MTRYTCKKLHTGSVYNFLSVFIISVFLLCLASTSVAHLSVKAISHQCRLTKQTILAQMLCYDHYIKWEWRKYWLSQSNFLQFQIIFSIVEQVSRMCQLELSVKCYYFFFFFFFFLVHPKDGSNFSQTYYCKNDVILKTYSPKQKILQTIPYSQYYWIITAKFYIHTEEILEFPFTVR